MKVANKAIGNGSPIYVVAEMACAHQGKPELAEVILHHAILAKADAIQFQIFSVDHLVSCRHSGFEQGKGLEISHADWADLLGKAKASPLDVWVNVFDMDSVEFAAAQGVDAIKIHSTDLSNPFMLDAVAATGLPVSLAVGGSLKEEMDYAVSYLRDKGVTDLILMHGYQGFPTPVSDNRLNFIQTLKNTYKLPVGFQDHAAGDSEESIWLPLMGIAAGADLIEKHITYDAGLTDIDYQSSLSPERFKDFVKTVREATSSMGSPDFQDLSEGEIVYRNKMKKFIVAANDLPAGHTITLNDLDFLRSETSGLQTKEVDKVIGKTTDKPYLKGEVINA